MVGDVIKKYRTDNGITLDEFAYKIEVTRSYLYMIESNRDSIGRIPSVPLSTFKKIAEVMGMDLAELIQLENEDRNGTGKRVITMDDVTRRNAARLLKETCIEIDDCSKCTFWKQEHCVLFIEYPDGWLLDDEEESQS